jgi:hypothetical protein
VPTTLEQSSANRRVEITVVNIKWIIYYILKLALKFALLP